jgi:hypothetical protein
MSIITNRIWAAAALVVLAPALDTTFRGDATLFSWTVAGISTWAGWTIPLLVAQYYLDRGDVPTTRTRTARPARLPVP